MNASIKQDAGHLVVAASTSASAIAASTNWWRVFWLSWAVVGAAVEILALARRQEGDTASETVWWAKGPAINTWRTFAVVAALVWLTLHLGFRMFS